MYLTHLALKHFRNYRDQWISFTAPKTIVVGENAQGKSNLLEAVELLATLKSHRTSRDRDLVQQDQPLAQVSASVQRDLGSAEMVSINQLVDIVEDIAGIKLVRRYKLDAPKGVRGRSSDNTLIKKLLGWEPSVTLREGLEKTYAWIYDQMKSGSLLPGD